MENKKNQGESFFRLQESRLELDQCGAACFVNQGGKGDCIIRPHWHDFIEIIFLACGEAVVYLNYTEKQVSAGDMVCIWSGVVHKAVTVSEECEFHTLLLLPEYFGSMRAELEKEKTRIPTVIQSERCTETLLAAFGLAYNSLEMRERGADCAERAALYRLAYELIQIGPPDGGIAKEERDYLKIKPALEYLYQNLYDPLSTCMLADICGLSPQYFCSLFRSLMGISCVTFIHDLRLKQAKMLLLQTQMTVTAVATGCGYENISYFNRLFRRKFGITPSEWRRCAQQP